MKKTPLNKGIVKPKMVPTGKASGPKGRPTPAPNAGTRKTKVGCP